MRQITTKSNLEKKKRTNQIIVGVVLIFVMLFGTLGYAFGGGGSDSGGGNSNKINYNGFEFVNQNDLWYTLIGNFQFVFQYNPEQVEKIDSEVNTLDKYYGKPLYISGEEGEAKLEIQRNLYSVAQRMQDACLDEKNCEGNFPVKNCSDNFIIIREAEIADIKQEENCVFIEGLEENITMVADEFLFKVIGIEK